jgi:hypothetical protein
MSERIWCTDWRNKGRFTKAERQRRCEIASVSPDWRGSGSIPPFVFAGAHLIGTAPCYLEIDGISSSLGWNREIREWAIDNGFDIMPDGQRLVIWESPDHRQKSYALNMAEPKAALGFAEKIINDFPWASGWHADYYTNLGWIAEEQEKAYAQDMELWARWDAGLISATNTFASFNKVVVAQQYHLTRATPPVNGLFLEVRPTAFGKTLADHERDKETLSQNGKVPVWCMEIRYPEYHSTDQLTIWRKWAATEGIYAAIGRDAAAQGAL